MLIPTADALGKGDFNAGIFFEDLGDATINDYVFNFGVIEFLDVGIDAFRLTSASAGQTLINAKYDFMPECPHRLGLAAGIFDLTDQLETSVYIVASKILGSSFRMWEGEVVAPARAHIGIGGGRFSSVFAGASFYFGDRVQVFGEWDSNNVNAGGRFRITPEVTIHAGGLNLSDKVSTTSSDRQDATFGVGLSFSKLY